MAPDAAKISKFKSYDFDSSDGFIKHLNNVELPAGTSAATALLKVKAKWYSKNVDPEFDPSWVLSPPSGQSYTSNSSSSHGSPQQSSSQQQSSNSAARGSNWGVPSSGSTGQPFPRQLQQALLQVAILLLALLYLQPAKPGLSAWAYNRLTMTMVISQSLKVLSYDRPAWNIAGFKAWLGRAARTSNGQYFLLALAAALSPPFTYVVAPFVVLAVYQIMDFLSEHYSSTPLYQKYGDPFYRRLISNQQHALMFNAQNEIMCGLLLLGGLILPSRRPLLTVAMWNILRMRYWSTDAAIYHRRVWQHLNQLTIAYQHKFPILQKIVDFGRNFFEQGLLGGVGR